MAIKTVNELGNVDIADEVVASIAGIATVGCAGVVGMASVRASDGLAELLKRENLIRGVKISTKGDQIIIDLHVIIEYGVSMVAVANNIIDAVRYNVESMTGADIADINVCVQGIRV
jgi:uncharacterized alkaline shock family protein YloU